MIMIKGISNFFFQINHVFAPFFHATNHVSASSTHSNLIWFDILTNYHNEMIQLDDFQRLVHFRIIQCVWIMFFHLLSLLLRRKQIYSSSTSYLSIIGHKHFPTEPPSHPYLSGSLHFTPQTSRYLTFILSKRKSFRCLARFYDAFHLVTIFC